jgi:hypothetical protein
MNKIIAVVVFLLIVLCVSRRQEKYGGKNELFESDEPTRLAEYEESENAIVITHDLMNEIILQANKAISKRTGLCTYIIETTSMKLYKHKKTGGKIFRCMFMVVKYGNKGFDFGFSIATDIRVINEGPRVETPGVGQKTQEIMETTENKIKLVLDKGIENLNEIELIKLRTDQKNLDKFRSASKVKIDDKPEVAILSIRSQPIDILLPENDKPFINPTKPREFEDYLRVKGNEIEYIKNTDLIQKQVTSAEEMYGKPKKVEVPVIPQKRAGPGLIEKLSDTIKKNKLALL